MERKLIRAPVYEYSIIKSILALVLAVSIGLVFAFGAFHVTAIVFRCVGLSIAVLFLSPIFLIVILSYFNSERKKNIDIPSKCYDKDLLPHTEYLALKKEYQRASEGQIQIIKMGFPSDMSAEDKMDMCKNYEKIIKTAGKILEKQDFIRSECYWKMIVGYIKIPAIYKDDKIQKDKYVKIDNQENINGNDFVKSDRTSFCHEIKSTEDVQNYKPFVSQSSATSEVTTVNHKNEFNAGEKIDMENILEKLKIFETQIAETKSSKEASEDKMKKKFEALENQFAKIQAENETLKETIEKLLESQSAF